MGRQKIESSEAETTPGDRTVGPGRPPVEHRFQKGQSGNPAGRPRRSGAPGDRLRGADEPTRDMIIAEAYRTVTVRDGDTEIEMPMNQAVFRAIGAAALNGSHAAQRRWAEMVQTAEAAQKRAQFAIYNVTERRTKEFEASLREYRGEEDEEAERYDPYAEDIIVDSWSGAVVIRGSGDDEQEGS